MPVTTRRRGPRAYNGFNELSNETITLNGTNSTHDGGLDDEEVHVIRRITRVFTRNVRNTYNDYTPQPVRDASRYITTFIPLPLLIFITLGILCTVAWQLNMMSRLHSAATTIYAIISSLPLMGSNVLHSLLPSKPTETLQPPASCSKEVRDAVAAMNLRLNDLEVQLSRNIINHDKMEGELSRNMVSHNELEAKYATLKDEMTARKSCCETLSKDLDANLRAFWLKVFPDLNDAGDDEFTKKVLHSLKRLIRNELAQPIQQTSEDMAGLEDKIQATIQHVLHKVEKLQEEKSFKSLPSTSSSLSEDMMKQLIAEALRIYDADKTGVPDFALEPAGKLMIAKLS